jgi:hypothetical protein
MVIDGGGESLHIQAGEGVNLTRRFGHADNRAANILT